MKAFLKVGIAALGLLGLVLAVIFWPRTDFTGVPVKKNYHLVDIYSPDLYVAQSELIRALSAFNAAKQNPSAFEQGFAETTLESARLKLRLLGILPDQIKEMEKTKSIQTH